MALAALEDNELWQKVAIDPRETPFIRTWAARMARGQVRTGATIGGADVLPCKSPR
jgi:hypothetical protein